MPSPIREIFDSPNPLYRVQITDDGSRTLIRTDTGDSFHSGCGALNETRHVYLHCSGVQDRLRHGRQTSVLEIGLGTAMGLLTTANLATHCKTQLRYTAIETDWLCPQVFRLLNPEQWNIQPELLEDYDAFRKKLGDEVALGRYQWSPNEFVRVNIVVGSVLDWTPQEDDSFDGIYFDPFAPESAPLLWGIDNVKKIASSLKNDGRLSTYSCSRTVRETMQRAGLHCQRVPGPPGGKREVLIAQPHQ